MSVFSFIVFLLGLLTTPHLRTHFEDDNKKVSYQFALLVGTFAATAVWGAGNMLAMPGAAIGFLLAPS